MAYSPVTVEKVFHFLLFHKIADGIVITNEFIGMDYKALEYHGEGVSRLTLSDRMTLANVSAEMGVKNSVFPPDDVLAKPSFRAWR